MYMHLRMIEQITGALWEGRFLHEKIDADLFKEGL